MANGGEWKQVNAYIQNACDKCERDYATMQKSFFGAFADPESYGKISADDDPGVAGITLAVRKQRDAEEDFNKVFIERAKKYSECKDEIKRKGAMLKAEFQKAEIRAKGYGLKCHND